MGQLAWTSFDFPLAALTLTLAIILVGGVSVIFPRVARQARTREFQLAQRHADGELRSLAERFGVPEATPIESPMLKAFGAQQASVRKIHKLARDAQEVYRDRITRCVASLWFAITVMAFSVTVLHDAKALKPYVAALDLVALLWVLHQWWFALAANYRWVSLRTKAELLRQESFLNALFDPQSVNSASDADVRQRFGEQEKAINESVIAPNPKPFRAWLLSLVRARPESVDPLEKRLRKYWLRNRERASQSADPSTQLATNDLLQYIHARPLRQLHWFRSAQYRLRRSSNARAATLGTLFVLAVLLALAKIASTHASDASLPAVTHASIVSDLLSFAVLGITAISAALSSLYLGRNDRSLLHRYAAQERRIEDWTRSFVSKVPGISTLIASPVSIVAVSDDLLAFEDLMIDELVDWIHVSQHDTIELAP
jgi:hypothetical protein